jgi:MFS family permease
MSISNELHEFVIMFLLYGIYAAATESVAKAWISNISEKKDIATAIGTYTGFQSMFTMIASSFAGFLWLTLGSSSTFLFTSATTFLVILYLIIVVNRDRR